MNGASRRTVPADKRCQPTIREGEAGGGTRPAAPRTHPELGPAGGLQHLGAPRRGARPGRSGRPWKAAFFVVMAAAIVVGAVRALLGSSLLVVRSVAVTRMPLRPRCRVLQRGCNEPFTPLARINLHTVAERL